MPLLQYIDPQGSSICGRGSWLYLNGQAASTGGTGAARAATTVAIRDAA